jgi:hypothetical protein
MQKQVKRLYNNTSSKNELKRKSITEELNQQAVFIDNSKGKKLKKENDFEFVRISINIA